MASADAYAPIPRRPLGRTGQQVTIFGLGGEGVLRTHGREAEAIAVIQRALHQGVNYFETAPAYASSMDYYGMALGKHRPEIFLASKTHDRTYDGSLRLLDDSLRRLQTDYLDLWQLHDLRSEDDLSRIFGKGGAMKALLQARNEGRVRYLGLTGHHDPAILLTAMQEFDFDTVLIPLNAADVHRLSFCDTVLLEAARRNMGIVGMKSTAHRTKKKARGHDINRSQRHLLELPLAPVSSGNQAGHRQGWRRAVVRHEPRTPVPQKVVDSNLIPVIHASVSQVLSQPIQVALPVAKRLPKPVRDRHEEPWLPIILRETLSNRRECRIAPKRRQPATVVPSIARPEFEPIEILHAAEAKSVCRPQQVIAAMRLVLPEAKRHATGHPHWVDPPQVSGVADRRAIDWFLLGCHDLCPFGGFRCRGCLPSSPGQLYRLFYFGQGASAISHAGAGLHLRAAKGMVRSVANGVTLKVRLPAEVGTPPQAIAIRQAVKILRFKSPASQEKPPVFQFFDAGRTACARRMGVTDAGYDGKIGSNLLQERGL